MANTLYDYGRQRFLEAQINWMTDTIKALLVDTGTYTPNTAAHQYLSDISATARIAGPVTLTSKSTTGGAADGADVTFTSTSGPARSRPRPSSCPTARRPSERAASRRS